MWRRCLTQVTLPSRIHQFIPKVALFEKPTPSHNDATVKYLLYILYIVNELEQRGVIEIILTSQLQQDDSCPGPLD